MLPILRYRIHILCIYLYHIKGHNLKMLSFSKLPSFLGRVPSQYGLDCWYHHRQWQAHCSNAQFLPQWTCKALIPHHYRFHQTDLQLQVSYSYQTIHTGTIHFLAKTGSPKVVKTFGPPSDHVVNSRGLCSAAAPILVSGGNRADAHAHSQGIYASILNNLAELSEKISRRWLQSFLCYFVGIKLAFQKILSLKASNWWLLSKNKLFQAGHEKVLCLPTRHLLNRELNFVQLDQVESVSYKTKNAPNMTRKYYEHLCNSVATKWPRFLQWPASWETLSWSSGWFPADLRCHLAWKNDKMIHKWLSMLSFRCRSPFFQFPIFSGLLSKTMASTPASTNALTRSLRSSASTLTAAATRRLLFWSWLSSPRKNDGVSEASPRLKIRLNVELRKVLQTH